MLILGCLAWAWIIFMVVLFIASSLDGSEPSGGTEFDYEPVAFTFKEEIQMSYGIMPEIGQLPFRQAVERRFKVKGRMAHFEMERKERLKTIKSEYEESMREALGEEGYEVYVRAEQEVEAEERTKYLGDYRESDQVYGHGWTFSNA